MNRATSPANVRRNVKTALESRLNSLAMEALGKRCKQWVEHLERAQEERWKRQDIYLRQAKDDFEWRVGRGGTPEQPKDVFSDQNDSLNVVGGYAEFMRARTIDDILGGEPIFTLIPQGGKGDKDITDAMQKHSEWRIRRSSLMKAFRDAIEAAYDIGEGVIKVSYEPKVDFREVPRNVLIATDGTPIVTPEGDFVFDDDTLLETTDESGLTVITAEKSPETVIPEGATTKAMFVEESPQIGEALQGRVLHHRDFLCPPNAGCIEEAPFLAHICQKRLSEITRLYSLNKETREKLARDSSEPKTAEKKPAEGESAFSDPTIDTTKEDPLIRLAECYLIEQTPKGASRQMVIVAVDSAIVLRADYLANVTPDGLLPFFVTRAFPVRGRWNGRGYFEIFAMAQDFIDRHLDYVTLRNRYHSDPMKFVRADCIEGLDTTGEFLIQTGKAHYLAPNKSGKEAVELLILPDLDDRTWQLMQTMIQMLGLRAGISSAAQGGVNSVPQANTATGVEAILSSGNTLSKLPINSIKTDLQAALFYALKLIYTNFDEEEAFTYLEGDRAMFLKLTRQQIAGMDFDIHLMLSRFRQRQQRENAETAIAAIEKYAAFQEIDKETVRPFFMDVIQSLGFDNAGQSLRKPLPPQENPPPAPPPL